MLRPPHMTYLNVRAMEERFNLAIARGRGLVLSIRRLTAGKTSHLLTDRTWLLNDAGKVRSVGGEVGLDVSEMRAVASAHHECKEVFGPTGHSIPAAMRAWHRTLRKVVVELKEKALFTLKSVKLPAWSLTSFRTSTHPLATADDSNRLLHCMMTAIPRWQLNLSVDLL